MALIVAFWPSIRGSSEITKAIENYPDAMKEFFGGAAAFDYTRPGGFLNTQLFSLLLPLLIGAFAIGYGASTLAGEQHTGHTRPPAGATAETLPHRHREGDRARRRRRRAHRSCRHS